MKKLARSVGFVLFLLALGRVGLAESLPEYRPALLGLQKHSLINMIDGQALMKRGQKDAILMFQTGITEYGDAFNSRTYRESPGSELLRAEVMGRMDQAHFEPAVYRHVHVVVYIEGTVVFAVRDGKPHVRIFLHQEEDLLKSGGDFIAPQFAFVAGNNKFQGIYYPPGTPGHGGLALVRLNVDATGKVEAANLVYEHPPGMNFGAQTLGPVRDALFIPGFRNGKPVACKFDWSMIFVGTGRQMRTG